MRAQLWPRHVKSYRNAIKVITINSTHWCSTHKKKYRICGALDRVLNELLQNLQADQSDVYYYLHKKLDDNYDVISALERQLMVEMADREKAETEFARQIDELERRRYEELGPMREKLITVEEQVCERLTE